MKVMAILFIWESSSLFQAIAKQILIRKLMWWDGRDFCPLPPFPSWLSFSSSCLSFYIRENRPINLISNERFSFCEYEWVRASGGHYLHSHLKSVRGVNRRGYHQRATWSIRLARKNYQIPISCPICCWIIFNVYNSVSERRIISYRLNVFEMKIGGKWQTFHFVLWQNTINK